MSLHGEFLLQSKVLTTWPPYWRCQSISPHCCRALVQHIYKLQQQAGINIHTLRTEAGCKLVAGHQPDPPATRLLWMWFKSPESLGKSLWVGCQPLSSTSTKVNMVNKGLKPRRPAGTVQWSEAEGCGYTGQLPEMNLNKQHTCTLSIPHLQHNNRMYSENWHKNTPEFSVAEFVSVLSVYSFSCFYI